MRHAHRPAFALAKLSWLIDDGICNQSTTIMKGALWTRRNGYRDGG
jgi:hypothetical protein